MTALEFAIVAASTVEGMLIIHNIYGHLSLLRRVAWLENMLIDRRGEPEKPAPKPVRKLFSSRPHYTEAFHD